MKQTRKRNERHTDQKEKNKTISTHRQCYSKKQKEATKMQQEDIRGFSKVTEKYPLYVHILAASSCKLRPIKKHFNLRH